MGQAALAAEKLSGGDIDVFRAVESKEEAEMQLIVDALEIRARRFPGALPCASSGGTLVC